jgi:hypothetical protein
MINMCAGKFPAPIQILRSLIMNKYSRLLMAVAIVGLVSLLAGGVWALPILGTVPPVPPSGGTTTCETIDMGTALITPKAPNCKVSVDLVPSPAELAPAPAGLVFKGDTFRIDVEVNTGLVKICFAYPPEFTGKNVKIYKLNELANPFVWVEVPGAIIENGVICVTTTEGVFSLIGNQ